MRKWLKRIGLTLAALAMLAVAISAWLLWTESGANFAVARVQGALDGKLAVGAVRGALTGPLELDNIRYRDAALGVDAKIQSLKVDLTLFALLRNALHLQTLDVEGVDIALTTVPPAAKPPPPTPLRQLLTPPLAMLLDRVHLGKANVTLDGQPLFAADSADVGFAWTANGFMLKQFSVRAGSGKVDLAGALTSYVDYRGEARLDIDWMVAPYHVVGHLDLHNDGRVATFALTLTQPLALTANGTLTANAPSTPWTLTLDVPGFDPAALTRNDALKTLALNLKGSGDRNGASITGSLDANQHRVLFDPLKLSVSGQTLTIESLHLRSPEAAGTLDASGKVRLDANPVGGEVSLNWDGVELPADLAGQLLETHGVLNASGNAGKFAASGDVSIGPRGKSAHVVVELDGTPNAITLRQLDLKQAHGKLGATGEITLKPQIGWNLKAAADQLDTGALAAQFPGALTFALSTSGAVEKDGPHGTLKLDRLGGTLRQRALSGNGAVTFAPPLNIDGTLDIASGNSHVALRGKGGTQTDASVDLTVASLGDWLPQAAGNLRANIAIKGAWPRLAVNGGIHGSKVGFGDTHLDTVDLTVDARDIAANAGGTLKMRAAHFASAGYAFDSLAVDARGDKGNHTVRIDAHGAPVSLALALDGALALPPNAPPGWHGTLSALTIDIKDQASWKLIDPAALSYSGTAFALGELCLRADTPQACVSASGHADGSAQAKYTLQHIPLGAIVRLAAPDAPLRVKGDIDGNGELTRAADGALNGHANLASASGSITYPDDAKDPLLAYRAFTVDAALAQQSSVTIAADLDNGGQLSGRVTLGANGDHGLPLTGAIQAHLTDLRFVDLLTTSVAATKGRLDADFALAGSTDAPQISGQLALAEFASEIPAAGLRLSDGKVTLRSSDGKMYDIDGSIASGGGKLALSGRAGTDANAPLSLKIVGEDFLAADIPGAQVRISPALTLTRDDKKFALSGEVGVPRANVDLSKLPGAGASKASTDVVVTDEAAAPTAATLPLDAVVTVKLGAGEKLAMDLRQGQEVHLVGFGLNGNLGGQLTVQDHPGRATSGRGQIEVNGTYKAYGQDLTIEQGRLLFAGTPVENPGLDIRATRAFPDQDVTVGLQVRGTAAAPELTVFSTPAMEQSDALSYLVAGKPLSQLRGGEGDAVGSAARALGTAGGDLLAKSIGAKMGLDDVGVADNSSVGGAALTVGKYLSPRLYLSYGVGLFTPGEVVTLRYRLTRHFDAEMANGTLSSRAGINYKIEK